MKTGGCPVWFYSNALDCPICYICNCFPGWGEMSIGCDHVWNTDASSRDCTITGHRGPGSEPRHTAWIPLSVCDLGQTPSHTSQAEGLGLERPSVWARYCRDQKVWDLATGGTPGHLGTGHWSDQLPEQPSACLWVSWETRGSRDQ